MPSITKARILRAVTEAKGERADARIPHLKTGDMAREAEALLADCGRFPEALRTQLSDPDGEETAEKDGETAMGDSEDVADIEELQAISPSVTAECSSRATRPGGRGSKQRRSAADAPALGWLQAFAIQLPCRPCGTRCGNRITATGSASICAASSSTRSLVRLSWSKA